ncbi:MAG: HAD-IIB family hydrolase [Acidobacteria bacterium]|nr:HAD-IIB family hydrolase [Acidobacteriota bacterium]
MNAPWIVLTDLDGTLLDARDFSVDPALPSIRRIQALGIPIVPVTSKTTAEVIPLAAELGLDGPAIVESGGAIVSLENGSNVVTPLGVAVEEIRARVPVIERESDARLLLFSAMSEDEASARSGLTGEALRRARERQFDEPFVLASGDLEPVILAAIQQGLAVREGGRFHHLSGPASKADAVRQLLSTFPPGTRVVAAGDAPMDGEFLALADIAVIVRGADGRPNASLVAALPDAIITSQPGPAGWAEAMDFVLEARNAGSRS